MQAAIGDRFCVRGNIVGQPERTGEIIEVRGAGGEPPYLVRFDDGPAHSGQRARSCREPDGIVHLRRIWALA